MNMNSEYSEYATRLKHFTPQNTHHQYSDPYSTHVLCYYTGAVPVPVLQQYSALRSGSLVR